MEIREALEAKMDEIEAQGDGAAPVPETAAAEDVTPPDSDAAEPAPSTEAKPDRSRDETGRFAKEAKRPAAPAPKAAPKPAPVVAGQKAGAAPALAGAPDKPAPAAIKAPQFLRPAVREKFSTLPPDVQQEIQRLNVELVRASKDAEALRKNDTSQAWTEAVRPYEAQIRAAGAEPVKYVGELLQTAHALNYAPPHQKAQLLSHLIMQYGPDLLRPDQQDANGNPSCPLDRALVQMMQGRPMQAQQAPQQQFRDPRLDQLLAQAQERQKTIASQRDSEAIERTQSFAAEHEFYGDVNEAMADILDIWAKQGKTEVSAEDLERAYALACNMNPDVAPLVEQRRAAEAAQKAAASAARARTAASSPRSTPTGTPAAAPKGLREVLEAKADELNW